MNLLLVSEEILLEGMIQLIPYSFEEGRMEVEEGIIHVNHDYSLPYHRILLHQIQHLKLEVVRYVFHT